MNGAPNGILSWLTPTRYLALTNLAGAGLGLVAGIYVARVLGPERLGIIGIIGSINTSIAAFVDFRLNDLAAKAFYTAEGLNPEEVPAFQAGVIWLAILGTTIVAGAIALCAALIGNFLVPLFTSSHVQLWWLPVDALTLSMGVVSGSLLYLLRFSRQFYAIGHWKLLIQTMSAVITIGLLSVRPTISFAYFAGLAGGTIGIAIALGLSWYLWTRRVALPMSRPDWRRAYQAYRQNLRMVWYGNLMGYAKLLQRSADVLVVAYFTGDRETGLYKLARQVVDNGLAILQDALYQVYYPNFLELFARRAAQSFRRLARRLLARSAVITVALLIGEILFLPTLVRVVFGPHFSGVELPMIILTSTFVFIVGCYTWLWAMFTGSGRLGGYTVLTLISILAQYAVILGLFAFLGPSAWAAMVGVVAYYVCLIPSAYGLALHRWPEFLPGGRRVLALVRA